MLFATLGFMCYRRSLCLYARSTHPSPAPLSWGHTLGAQTPVLPSPSPHSLSALKAMEALALPCVFQAWHT